MKTPFLISCFFPICGFGMSFLIRTAPRILCQKHTRPILGCRTILHSHRLGVEDFKRNKKKYVDKLGNQKEMFLCKMGQVLEKDSPMIYSADLKTISHVAESPLEVDMLINMLNIYSRQERGRVSLSEFTVGPVIMRLLFTLDDADTAFNLYMHPELQEGLFDQIVTATILLQLLYNHGQYDNVHAAMKTFMDKQINGQRFAFDPITVAIATCLKQGSREGYSKMMEYMAVVTDSGSNMPPRSSFHALMLALRLGEYIEAERLLDEFDARHRDRGISIAAKKGYLNLLLLLLCRTGRLEEAVAAITGEVLQDDKPQYMQTRGQIFKHVLDELAAAVEVKNKKELSHQFEKLSRELEKDSHIIDVDLEDFLLRPIYDGNVTGGHKSRQQRKYSARDHS